MFGFRKTWRGFSCNTRSEIRPLALLPTILRHTKLYLFRDKYQAVPIVNALS